MDCKSFLLYVSCDKKYLQGRDYFPDERMLLQLTESLTEPHFSSAKSVSKNAFLMKASSSTTWVLSLDGGWKVLERLWKAGILLSYPGIVLTITHVFWHPYLLPAA